MADIWLRTIKIAREETRCCIYMGYYFRVAARVLLYAPPHRQDSTYHGLCHTSRGELGQRVNHSSVIPDLYDDSTLWVYIAVVNALIHVCCSESCNK